MAAWSSALQHHPLASTCFTTLPFSQVPLIALSSATTASLGNNSAEHPLVSCQSHNLCGSKPTQKRVAQSTQCTFLDRNLLPGPFLFLFFFFGLAHLPWFKPITYSSEHFFALFSSCNPSLGVFQETQQVMDEDLVGLFFLQALHS